jgi:hypothetical protein
MGSLTATQRLRRSAPHALAPLARVGVHPQERFVIYCPPRTGSTMLTSLLDQHPEVRCEGELLARFTPNPVHWIDGRAAWQTLRGRRAWGFKVITLHNRWYSYEYGTGAELLGRLVDRGFQVVTIRRRDWLMQALSASYAARAGKYHHTTGDGATFTRPHVDPIEVLALLHTMEEEDEVLQESVRDVPHLSLWYEDDLLSAEAKQRTLDRLCDRLHLGPVTATTPYRPVAAPTLADRVRNPDEIAELLGSTRFARFVRPPALAGR